MSSQKLTPSTIALLVLPTILWAGNAVVGRLIIDIVPPITLNFMRWAIALGVLLIFGASVLRSGSAMWHNWRRYAALGLFGVGLYNALQYLALQSSTPINVTLVGASMPIWTLLIGRIFFGAVTNTKQMAGAVVSLIGVAVILIRGDWHELFNLRFVPGDIYMIFATIAWAFYSWMIGTGRDSNDVTANWATFLVAHVFFGVIWSGAFAAGEWALTDWSIQWGWPLYLALVYVSIGPAIIAFRCWGSGVRRVGAATAGFFANLIPLFAALLSIAFLGQMPQLYHGLAFLLIVGGIVLSSRR